MGQSLPCPLPDHSPRICQLSRQVRAGKLCGTLSAGSIAYLLGNVVLPSGCCEGSLRFLETSLGLPKVPLSGSDLALDIPAAQQQWGQWQP